jgi:hypothetical protein
MTAPESPRADVELSSVVLDALHAAHHRPGSITMMDLAESMSEAIEEHLAERLEVVTTRAESAEAERDQLRRWKDEALPVIAGLQELGRALGLRLGVTITGPEGVKAAEELRAERDDLRALRLAVETLAEEWAAEAQAGRTGNGHPLLVQTYDGHARDLRAVLASPSTHTQQDTEAQRDARLDNLIEREERAAEGCLDCKAGEPHMCPDARADSLATGEEQS